MKRIILASAVTLLLPLTAHAAASPASATAVVPKLTPTTITLSRNQAVDILGQLAHGPIAAVPPREADPTRPSIKADPGHSAFPATDATGLHALDGHTEWNGDNATTKPYQNTPDAHEAVARDIAALTEMIQAVNLTVQGIQYTAVAAKVAEGSPDDIKYGKDAIDEMNRQRQIEIYKIKAEWLDPAIPTTILGQIDKLIDYGDAAPAGGQK